MLGWIVNRFMEFITQTAGQPTTDKISEMTSLNNDAIIKNDTSYPDYKWQALIFAAIEETGLAKDELERKFAEYFFDRIIEDFGAFFKKSNDAFDFITNLIHLYRTLEVSSSTTEVDKFALFANLRHKIIIRYKSPTLMCDFVRRIIELSFNHYHEENYSITETICAKEGSPYCEFIIEKIHYG
ncbi:MAG: hypothetical protein GF404_01630 [candidate division Zixibacteria bacterium]|nr:hypothetical protein [candidate division Zixibacteria bacterium]